MGLMSTTVKVRPDIRKAEQDAYTRAYNAEFPEAIRELVELLGVQLVAIIGGVTDGRRVRDWKAGKRDPRDPDSERALRLGLQMALMLTSSGRSHRVAQAWFQGGNPALDYRAPAMVLRAGPIDAVSPALVEAARSFIVE
jgi:hypothetical protein